MSLSEVEIRAYLVGAGDVAERQRIEEEFFSNTSSFDAIVDGMDAICDEMLRGTVSEVERERLADLTTSGLWAERLRFATALREVAARRHTSVAPPAPPAVARVVSLGDWIKARDWKAQLRMAAVLLSCLLGWPAYWLQVVRQRQELALANDRAATQVASVRAREVTTQAELDSARLRLSELEIASQKQVTAQFALFPTFTRGGEALLVVKRNAAFVRLELALEDGTPSGPYRAELFSRAETMVYSAVVRAGSDTPTIVVPTQSLPAGEYRLALVLASRSETAATVATFHFTIIRK